MLRIFENKLNRDSDSVLHNLKIRKRLVTPSCPRNSHTPPPPHFPLFVVTDIVPFPCLFPCLTRLLFFPQKISSWKFSLILGCVYWVLPLDMYISYPTIIPHYQTPLYEIDLRDVAFIVSSRFKIKALCLRSCFDPGSRQFLGGQLHTHAYTQVNTTHGAR